VSSFYRFSRSFNQSLNDGARKKINLFENDLEYSAKKIKEYTASITSKILQSEKVSIIIFDFNSTNFNNQNLITKVALRNLKIVNNYAKGLSSRLMFVEKQQEAVEVIYLHDRNISSTKLAQSFSHIRMVKIPSFTLGHPLRFWRYVFKLSRGNLMVFCDIEVLFSKFELWSLLNIVRTKKKAITFTKPVKEKLVSDVNHIACFHSVKNISLKKHKTKSVRKLGKVINLIRRSIQKKLYQTNLLLNPSKINASWDFFAINKEELNRFVAKLQPLQKKNFLDQYKKEVARMQNINLGLKKQVFSTWNLMINELHLHENFYVKQLESTLISRSFNKKWRRNRVFRLYAIILKTIRLVVKEKKLTLRRLSHALFLIPVLHLALFTSIIFSTLYGVFFWQPLILFVFLLPFSIMLSKNFIMGVLNLPIISILVIFL